MFPALRLLRRGVISFSYRSFASASFQFNHNFSDKEVSEILNVINEKSANELENYTISKGRAQKIELWKKKNGKFNDLSEILELENFGQVILERFCKSILSPARPVENQTSTKTRKPTGRFTTPALPESQRKKIKTCLGLHIGITTVSWAKLNLNPGAPIDISAWDHHEIGEKYYHISELVELMKKPIVSIPEADVYTLESPQTAQPGGPGSANQVNINVQRAQMAAMISLVLAMRSSTTNVFYLRQFLPSRLFRTFVGNEPISTDQAMLNLLRVHYNVDEASSSPIEGTKSLEGCLNASLEFRKLYNEAEGARREFLGRSLLTGLAFARLMILQCPKSIALLSTRSTKKPIDETELS